MSKPNGSGFSFRGDGNRSGRKIEPKNDETDQLINPSLENQFLPGSKDTPRMARLITRLDTLMHDGDPEALSMWIKEQSWAQISQCLIQQSVREGRSNMSALHGMSFFIKVKEQKGVSQEFVDFLVSAYVRAGCDINASCDELVARRRTRKGFTPLLLAIERLNSSMVMALLNAGADVNKCDFAGWSPLHWAAYMNLDIRVVQDLVKAGANMATLRRNSVHPVLHVAVDEGREEIVNFLLENGVDVNTLSTYSVLSEDSWSQLSSRYDCAQMQGDTVQKDISAVGRAVRMRKISVLQILLRHPRARVTMDELHFCILEGDTRVANIIVEHIDKSLLAADKIAGRWAMHCLGETAFVPKYEPNPISHTKLLIKTYVDNGWDINSISRFSKDDQFSCGTLLIRAVKIGDSDFVQFLVDTGARCTLVPDAVCKNNSCHYGLKSPIHMAIYMNNFKAFKIFADSGFDFSLPSGKTIKDYMGASDKDNEYPDKEMTIFEALLSKFKWNRESQEDREYVMYTIKKILDSGLIIMDSFHIFLAMKTLGMELVLEFLHRLPSRFLLKGCFFFVSEDDITQLCDCPPQPEYNSALRIPILQWFIHKIFEIGILEFQMHSDSLIEIIEIFRLQGYDLNTVVFDRDVCQQSLGMLGIISLYKYNNPAFFDYMIEIPDLDWNQQNNDGDTPIAETISHCFLEDHETFRRMYRALFKLLSKGVILDRSQPIVSFLRATSLNKWTHRTELIKTLWWCGSDFNGFEHFLNEVALTNMGICEKVRLVLLRDWWFRIGKVPCLTRLAAIHARKLLKNQDLDTLTSSSRFLKELILDIPGRLYH